MALKNFLKHLPVLLISILPLGYLTIVWNNLPEKIPVHYNIQGDVDRYGSNLELLFITILLFVSAFSVYLLLTNIHKIDPKRANATPTSTFNKIGAGVILFMTITSLIIIVNAINPDIKITNKILLPSVGLLFMFLGNYMYTIKPNHFVGIRVPWTLESDYNWKKTHQLGAKLFFIGGLSITVLALTCSFTIAAIATITISILVSIISIGYSYSIFKQESTSSK